MTNEEKINFLKENDVDVETGIENMMDIETYNDILNDFYDSFKEELAKIDNFKNLSDMPNYAILVHALKSNARSFGFNRLGEIAYDHEMKSKQGDISYINEHYNELVSEANRVYDVITKYKNL